MKQVSNKYRENVQAGSRKRVRECFAQHFRRLIVIASLYFKLKGTQTPTQEEVERVNRKFNLVLRPAAIHFPAALSCWIWRKVDLDQMIVNVREKKLEAYACASVCLAVLPGWMKYKGIEEDLVSVVQFAV